MVVEGCFLDWRPVTNDILQGTVMGPLLHVIYIDNLNEIVDGMVSELADGTKYGEQLIMLSKISINWDSGPRNGKVQIVVFR